MSNMPVCQVQMKLLNFQDAQQAYAPSADMQGSMSYSHWTTAAAAAASQAVAPGTLLPLEH